MVALNKVGALLGRQEYVHAMTDVTGFGLLGHLREMVEASNLQAEIDFDKVPLLDLEERQRQILCDPQTSGGLLVAIAPHAIDDFKNLVKPTGIQHLEPLGRLKAYEGKHRISVL